MIDSTLNYGTMIFGGFVINSVAISKRAEKELNKAPQQVRRKLWAKKELENVTFAELIKDLRQCEGISQVELAKHIGVSKQFISDIEHDRRPVTIAIAKKIAKSLGYAIEPMLSLIFTSELKKNKLSFDVEVKRKSA